jgi:hypothetical protein
VGRPCAWFRDLGVSAEPLRHWVKQDALDSGLRKDGLTTDERKELNQPTIYGGLCRTNYNI